MLIELGLKNFILIKETKLEFGPGFTVFTGETGAGKSILVKALKLIMGDRASSDVVGPHSDKTIIQAMLEIDKTQRDILDELGISHEEDILIVRRIISSQTRSKIYANGEMITLNDLKKITASMISIEGQHAFQDLMRPMGHMNWLDRFAGTAGLRQEIKQLYYSIAELSKKLEDLNREETENKHKKKKLKSIINEIYQLNLRDGEDDELEKEIRILKSAVQLKEAAGSCYNKIYSSRGSIYELLADARQDIAKLSGLDPALDKIHKDIESCGYQLEETAYALRDYVQKLSTDPSRLEQAESRLSDLKKILRKYGPSVRDVLKYRQELEAQLNQLDSLEHTKNHIKERLSQQGRDLLNAAEQLSRKRADAARSLASGVEKELSQLNMHKCKFIVEQKTPEAPSINDIGPNGLDHIQFLFTPNPGLDPRPVSSIASGGELSRVMLALRICMANKTRIETLVFDEIDAGIGGKTAKKVGAKLRELSKTGQVIAITHFPQIAAMADHQYALEKHSDGESTRTVISSLSEEQRLRELARMLGGEADAATEYAARLLEERK